MHGISALAVWNRFRERAFFRNIFVVMSGTAVSQLVGLAFSPVLSRLFGPADFGILGSFLVIASVVGVGATLNYTDALMLPEKHEEAAPLFLIACLSSLVIALVTGACCMLISIGWLELPGIGSLHRFLWLLPVSVLLFGITQSLTTWCTRLQAYKETSQAQLLRAMTTCATQAASGVVGLGGAGLIGGAVIGDLPTTAFLGRLAFLRSAPAFRASARWPILSRKAWEYREFAFYGCPQNVMNALSQGLPILVLAKYYGAAVAGSYAFGIRLLQAPMNLVLTSVRQVLFQKLSEINASGKNLYLPFLKSTGGLIALGFLPASIGFLAAPSVFAFVFGEEWREAGHYARWLILWLGVAFCNVPSTLAARILRLQRDLFLFDLSHLSARAVTLVLGGIWLGPLQTVIALSILGALFNVALILYVATKLRNGLCSG